VQVVIKDGLETEHQHLWIQRIVAAIVAVFPNPPDYGSWAECERLISHSRIAAEFIKSEKLNNLDADVLLHQTAYYLEKRAQYAEAEQLFERALVIREKALGSGHPDVATMLNSLATLYQSLGRYEEAEPLYDRVLSIYEEALGNDHPLMISLMIRL
jgi:tetratricopeptide (TPR) repeat protein